MVGASLTECTVSYTLPVDIRESCERGSTNRSTCEIVEGPTRRTRSSGIQARPWSPPLIPATLENNCTHDSRRVKKDCQIDTRRKFGKWSRRDICSRTSANQGSYPRLNVQNTALLHGSPQNSKHRMGKLVRTTVP